MEQETVIKIESLTKRYGAQAAVDRFAAAGGQVLRDGAVSRAQIDECLAAAGLADGA